MPPEDHHREASIAELPDVSERISTITKQFLYGTEQSFGGPNVAVDPTKTIVWNHDLTGHKIPDPDASKPPFEPTHITIDDQTNNTVIVAVQKALRETQVRDFMDVI